jgi:hypothetical protein
MPKIVIRQEALGISDSNERSKSRLGKIKIGPAFPFLTHLPICTATAVRSSVGTSAFRGRPSHEESSRSYSISGILSLSCLYV